MSKCKTCGQDLPDPEELVDPQTLVRHHRDAFEGAYPIRILYNGAGADPGMDENDAEDCIILGRRDARKLAAFIYRHTSPEDE